MTEAVDDKPAQLLTAGDTGLRQSGGQLLEEYARALRGRKGVETYQEMADSPLPGAFLLLVELLARQCEWTVDPAIPGDAEAEHWAEFVRGCMDDLDTDWRQVVGEHLTSIQFGWARSEILYKIRRGPDAELDELRSDFDDGCWGWRDFSPRSQDSLYRWCFERGRVVAMEQMIIGGQGGSFTVPESKMIAVIPRPYKRSPEGRSMFRPGSRPWFYGRKIEDSEALGLDRDLTGVVHQQVPGRIMDVAATGADLLTRQSWEEKIRKLRRGQLDGLLVPAEEENGKKTGYLTKLMASGGTGRINPDTAIRRHESRLLISLLSEFLLLGVDGVGARAVADPKINLVNLAIGALLDVFGDAVNTKAVADLMRLNSVPPRAWPKIVRGPIDAPDLPELVTMLSSLVGAGLVLPTDQLQRWLMSQIPGAPVADPESTPNQGGADDSEDLTIAQAPPSSPAVLASLISARDVKRQLGIGTIGLHRLIAEGKLAAYRVLDRWKFDPAAVQALLTASAHVVQPDAVVGDD